MRTVSSTLMVSPHPLLSYLWSRTPPEVCGKKNLCIEISKITSALYLPSSCQRISHGTIATWPTDPVNHLYKRLPVDGVRLSTKTVSCPTSWRVFSGPNTVLVSDPTTTVRRLSNVRKERVCFYRYEQLPERSMDPLNTMFRMSEVYKN